MIQNKLIRLQKFLADSGIASRRKAEQMILAGEIKVNGIIAKIGDKVNPKTDKVTFKNNRVPTGPKHYYIMLNKPRGYVTTMSDERGRKCVAELVSEVPARIYPVGRLDKDSEGLLFMTNDGEFSNKILHPSKHIEKKYRVTVKPSISEDQLTKIAVGMVIDGRKTEPANINLISQQPGRVVLEITLKEGRNRQIRKMCEKLGLEVAKLKRISIGTVKLGMLKPGQFRELKPEELKKLNYLS